MDWTHRWADITQIRNIENGIELLIGQKGKKMLGMFGSGEQQKKVIRLMSKPRREQLVDIMARLQVDAKKDS